MISQHNIEMILLTLMQRQREKGRVAMMSRTDRQVRMQAAGPGPSGSARERTSSGSTVLRQTLGNAWQTTGKWQINCGK